MTTSPPLGPLSTAEIFDTAFRLYRGHLPTFLRIAFSLYGPLLLLKFILAILFLEPHEWDFFLAWPLPLGISYGIALSDDTGWAALTILLRVLELFFLQPITIGILCNAAAQAYLQQSDIFQKAYKLEQPALVSLHFIGVMIIPINTIILLSGWSLLDIIYTYPNITNTNPAVLIILLGSIIVYTRLIFAPAVIVIEGYRPLASWIRSWKLGRGARWQVMQVVALSNLLMAILVFSFGLSLRAGIQYMIPNGQAELLGYAIGHVLWVISFAFQAIVYTILYYNQCVRKEGFDFALKLDRNVSIYSSHPSVEYRRLSIIIAGLVIIASMILFLFLFVSQPPIP